jgi:drug/metabolite transporter (DMT)-like permease
MNHGLIPTPFKLFLTAIFWGGTWIAGKIVATNMSPFSAAFLRFAIASSILIAVVRKIEGRLPLIKGRQLIAVIFLGLTGIFAYNYCFFQGLKFINAGRSALIVTTNPIFITVLSSCLFKEKLNWLKFAGIMLSVSGAVIVISRGNPLEIINDNIEQGESYIIGCVLSWVTYSFSCPSPP